MGVSGSDQGEMKQFLAAGETAADGIKTAFNAWCQSVAPLAASKGLFATAFEKTRLLVEGELTNLSNEMKTISANVESAGATHQAADQQQDDEIKRIMAKMQAVRG